MKTTKKPKCIFLGLIFALRKKIEKKKKKILQIYYVSFLTSRHKEKNRNNRNNNKKSNWATDNIPRYLTSG